MNQIEDKKDLYNLFELYKIVSEHILISYRGPFDKKVLNILGNNVKDVLIEYPVIGKKIFKIFVELAQNIALYSAERQRAMDSNFEGVGILLVKDIGHSFEFVTGNYILKRELDKFIEKAEKINSMEKEELRKYKREQLMLPDGNSGGANIGLVQAILLSDHSLNLHVEPYNNLQSFLAIGVTIKKDFSNGKY